MKDLVEISNELNFSEKSGGDWGIINTNPNRVQEFVEYLKINTMSVSDKHEFTRLYVSVHIYFADRPARLPLKKHGRQHTTDPAHLPLRAKVCTHLLGHPKLSTARLPPA